MTGMYHYAQLLIEIVAQAEIHQISVSQVIRITGDSPWHQALKYCLSKILKIYFT
jgi:spore coat polysaccharide biosynthesis protein SpsF (cytidylyltransferase family)